MIINDLIKKIDCQIIGSKNTEVNAFATLVKAKKENIVYINHKKYLADLETSSAGAVIISKTR